MRRHWLRLTTVAVLSAAAFSGRASEPARQADPDGFVITHVRVFDGERSRSSQNVVITGEVIRAIEDDTSEFRSVRTIDGTGATLLPGLIDAHTHTQDVDQLQQALRFGVTTVLDMFTPPAVEPALRGAAAARVDVADFRSSGVLATAPGGHGTGSPYLLSHGRLTPSPSSARGKRPAQTT